MDLKDYPQPYKELYAVHQRLLQLGFAPDDIFVSVSNVANPQQRNVLCAHLRAQDKEFVYTIASLGDDIVKSEVYARWSNFVTRAKAASSEELNILLRSTLLGSRLDVFSTLVAALRQKGFQLSTRQGASL